MTEAISNDPRRVHVWVTGRVQGVGFRAFVQRAGTSFGLTGWVRNVGYDGVETVAEGPRKVLEQFVESVKNGPRVAYVEEAKVEWEMPQGECEYFEVR
jgi:acylphosphatase